MKKIFLSAVLAVFGWAMTSQAVVISWASDALLSGTVSAKLVYVSNDSAPTYNGSWSANATELATAPGGAISGTYLYDVSTTDSTTRSAGRYYVVLFDTGSANYAVSGNWLAHNAFELGTSEFDPPETFYATFGSWTPVPEPSSAALLCLGAAAVALRRRKRA